MERVKGECFDIKLSLVFSEECNLLFKLDFCWTAKDNKPSYCIFSLWMLRHLRNIFAKFLVEHDGSEEIVQAPTIPQELLNYYRGF